MNAVVPSILENPTEPWPLEHEPATVTAPKPKPRIRQYAVMASDSSERAARGILASLGSVSEALELLALPIAADVIVVADSLNETALRLMEHPVSKNTEATMNRIFSAARDEQFEPGMDSQFTKGLDRFFLLNPSGVFASLKKRLSDDGAAADVLAEMLYWAARQEAPAVRTSVIDLLAVGLSHRSPLVRDAAALGIADLGHAGAVGLLRNAAERETVPELREDMESLVRSLEM